MLRVLFICTGNSARSIMAEAALNHIHGARGFAAMSAGSHPTGTVNPIALEVLQANHIPTDGLRSKSWDEFSGADVKSIAFVFTVCDNAAGEVCPVWPGQPITAHWGVPDPAAVEGSDDVKRRAFVDALAVLKRRIDLFCALPVDKLSRLSLQAEVSRIGREG
jgi:protein-tyrosine-phosphatase